MRERKSAAHSARLALKSPLVDPLTSTQTAHPVHMTDRSIRLAPVERSTGAWARPLSEGAVFSQARCRL